VIVADTGAIVALVDASDRHHRVLRELYESDPHDWLLPWAILPEVDHLLLKYVGAEAERLFVEDVAEGRYAVEWPSSGDLDRAAELNRTYADLNLGIVDASVMAVAERIRARAIATLDLRDFAPVALAGSPRLLPRDL
jgi:predicted nucleic acid-binding protein